MGRPWPSYADGHAGGYRRHAVSFATPSRSIPVRPTAGAEGAMPVTGGGWRPAPLSATVSAQMSRMPRASTAPELMLRRELHRRGVRFRVNLKELPGRPDIAFTRARIAVFVDGCFWHRCPEHGTLPKNNREWWLAKLDRNVERDREKDTLLREAGWTVVHLWEHEDPIAAADRVERLWRSSRISEKEPVDIHGSPPAV
jgi:DNA mismatch endonuclease (patch repair protein)